MKKQVLVWVLGIVSFMVLTTGLLFYFGVIGNAYSASVGKKSMDIQRENFKHSQSYVEGKIQDLSSYYHEYNQKQSDDEKQAILSLVRHEFANFDSSVIEDPNLISFLEKARQ